MKKTCSLLLTLAIVALTATGGFAMGWFGPSTIRICPFNIMWLGHYTKKDDSALASILKDYDPVVVQELTAPPASGTYPDNTAYTSDAEAKEFFDEMEALGFEYELSEEDTGTNDDIHTITPSTEWWVAFYKPSVYQ